MVSIRFLSFFALAAFVIAIPLEDETKVSSAAALKLASPPNEKAVTCQIIGSDGCVNIRSGPGTNYAVRGCFNPGTVSRLLGLSNAAAGSSDVHLVSIVLVLYVWRNRKLFMG